MSDFDNATIGPSSMADGASSEAVLPCEAASGNNTNGVSEEKEATAPETPKSKSRRGKATGASGKSVTDNSGASNGATNGRRFVELPTSELDPDPEQEARQAQLAKTLGPEGRRRRKEVLDDLKASITIKGILVPLLVRKRKCGRYFVLDGHHRLIVARELGFPYLPCVVVEENADEESTTSVEQHHINRYRRALSPLEQALDIAYAHDKHPELTQADIGDRFGRKQSWINDCLTALAAETECPRVYEKLQNGELGVSPAAKAVREHRRKLKERAAEKKAKLKDSPQAPLAEEPSKAESFPPSDDYSPIVELSLNDATLGFSIVVFSTSGQAPSRESLAAAFATILHRGEPASVKKPPELAPPTAASP